ncbi:synaptic vesicle glycoprotein 2B isoform X1 [Drosophila suzukii]|uniref:Synaptic vesicle glycoprotein 2B isoform X1 n=1 Tax=Drosophila suzukii TaxID=28584 RepID=A0AB40A8Q8_DROSZ
MPQSPHSICMHKHSPPSTGFGRVHLFATLTLGLLQMLTIQETMGMGTIGPAAVCDLHMNQAQLAALTAAGFMGIICSSYFWGYITDKKGRRWTLLRTIIVSNLCSIASMFCISSTGFFVMRFVTCIFVAGPSFVAATYLSEFCSQRILVRTITHMYMFSGFAMISCPAWATLFLSPDFIDFEVELVGDLTLRPWRVLGCIYILPGVVAFFLLLHLPESPKFLMMIGDTQKGLATMEWISKKNTGHGLTDDQIQHMLAYEDHVRMRRRKSKQNVLRSMLDDAMPLFRKPYLGYFLCVCFVMFVLGLLTNGLGIWFTAMRNRCNMRQGNTQGMTFCRVLFVPETGPIMETEVDFEAVCDDSFKGFNNSFVLGAVYVALYNLCWLSLFCVHKKVMFVFSLVSASTFGFLLIVVTDPMMQLFSLVFVLAFPGVTIGLLGGALLRFVPTYIRAKALCISLMWCRCGAAVGAILVGSNIQDHCELFLLAIAILPLIAACMEGYLPL